MGKKTFDELLDLTVKRGKKPYSKVMKARPHTPVYMMHKFWARRPYNVFAELVKHCSEPNDIILDPFCGGGVTVVEALRLKRKVVGVDINPLATYVTEMEVRHLNIDKFCEAYEELKLRIEPEFNKLYETTCPKCHKSTVFDWLEWEGEKPTVMKYVCPNCGVGEKEAKTDDAILAKRISENFEGTILEKELWYPKAMIPKGDKTNSIIKKGCTYFWQLFTKRNLLVLSILHKEISSLATDKEVKDFLKFAFSGSLKWASKQSHLRGKTVEGWAMHAYWLYPKTLEINVWNTFTRRCNAVARGKKYSSENIGNYFKKADSFEDLLNNKGTCLILTQSSTDLPILDEKVDVIITDPPYGGNVNYGELADYWMVWKNEGKVIDKTQEIIINRNQKKELRDYEEGLKQVFDECFRVLKREGNMVVTFNSRKLPVVASFVIATARAGFKLHPQGLVYQPPIRAYTTTFHAMQIGAFTGDFIFTFYKPTQLAIDTFSAEIGLKNFREQIDGLIDNHIGDKITEPELREKAYRRLIPFLALHAKSNLRACREAVNYFELQMKKLEPHFKELRKQIIKERRRRFSAKL